MSLIAILPPSWKNLKVGDYVYRHGRAYGKIERITKDYTKIYVSDPTTPSNQNKTFIVQLKIHTTRLHGQSVRLTGVQYRQTYEFYLKDCGEYNIFKDEQERDTYEPALLEWAKSKILVEEPVEKSVEKPVEVKKQTWWEKRADGSRVLHCTKEFNERIMQHLI